MYQGKIIDAHMHLWDPNNGYEWLRNPDPFFGGGSLNHDFFVPDYLAMAQNQNIVAVVHVECGGFPEDPVKESEWLQQQADSTGWPQGIVAHANLAADDIEHQLERHLACRNLRGIRMLLSYSPKMTIQLTDHGDYMQDKAFRRGYALLGQHDLTFDMQIYGLQLEDAYQLAKAHPETRLVLSHLASPTDFSLEGFAFWRQGVERMASLPQVVMKLSCVGCIFQKNDPALITPYLHAAIDAFGPERCLFGSNCPPDGVHITFDDIYTLFKRAVQGYSQTEQQAMFFDTAQQVYRLGRH